MKKYKFTKKHRLNISIATKKAMSRSEVRKKLLNNKNHKGHKRTLETRNKIGKANLGKKNGNYKHGYYSKNYHNYCIDCKKEIVSVEAKRCKSCNEKIKQLGKKNGMYGKLPKHGIAGSHNEIKMRSSWELSFALWLDLSNIKWLYESKTFDLGNATYTPDFYLPEFDTYIEVKGLWIHKAKKKFKKFKRQYKNINIKVFNQEKLNQIGILDKRGRLILDSKWRKR